MNSRASIILATLLSLTACGGGGNGAPPGGNVPPPPGPNGLQLPDLITASYMLDVDNDGDLDILVGTQGDQTRDHDILLINDGIGNFTEKTDAFPAHYLGTEGSTVNFESADFNNDGNPDVIASTIDARSATFGDTIQIHLYLGNGDGTFSDSTSTVSDSLITSFPEWIRVGDFDNDGFTDFLITSNGCQAVSTCHGGRIYLNDGSSNFSIATITTTDAERSYSDTKLIWENDGNTQPGQGSDRVPLDVFVDDLNGDGKIDLVAPNGYAAGPVIVSFLNNSTPGNLAFDIVYNLSNPADPFDGTIFKNGALMDINGDGMKDVIGSASISGQDNVTTPVFAFISQGGGGLFTEDNTVFSLSQPGVEHARQWLVADFNQDNMDDLIVADHGFDFSPFPGEKNLLLLSNGTGTLEDVTATNLSSVSGFTHGVTAGDINGDGFPDLFLNNASIEPNGQFLAEIEARLWINNGDGSFTIGDL